MSTTLAGTPGSAARAAATFTDQRGAGAATPAGAGQDWAPPQLASRAFATPAAANNTNNSNKSGEHDGRPIVGANDGAAAAWREAARYKALWEAARAGTSVSHTDPGEAARAKRLRDAAHSALAASSGDDSDDSPPREARRLEQVPARGESNSGGGAAAAERRHRCPLCDQPAAIPTEEKRQTEFTSVVDPLGVALSFLTPKEQMECRLVYSRWDTAVANVLDKVKCVEGLADEQLEDLVTKFPELRSVDLGKCERLTAVVGFNSLRFLGALDSLVIGRQRKGSPSTVTADVLKIVSRIKTLTSLTVAGSINNFRLDDLVRPEAPRLKTLDVSGVQKIDAAAFAVIAQLPALESLTLGGGAVTNAALAIVCHAVRLTSLDLRRCDELTMRHLSATDLGVAPLVRLTALLTLRLPSQANDEWLAVVGGLTSLTSLDLGAGCPFVTIAGMAKLSPLVGLTELDLSRSLRVGWSGALANRSLATVGRFVRLEKLCLSGCTWVTNEGVGHLLTLTALKELRLEGCKQPTKEGLAPLLRLPSLRTLDLRGCVLRPADVVGLRVARPGLGRVVVIR